MRSRLRTVLALGVILLLAIVFRARILGAAGSLAGDGWGHRILTAAQLERDGYVPKVIVSGTDGVYGNYECDLAIPFAVRHGYPESYFMHLEHHARSTLEEARAVVPELRRLGYKRVIVVTNNYHTRRSRQIFQRMAPDLTILMGAAPDEFFTVDGWWRQREAQKTLLTEYEKLIANWLGI
ncbi:MAG: YdcF family protein [Bryobacterales bacterium]|nr:YdcF family protein [Bryobacterales bacterium]